MTARKKTTTPKRRKIVQYRGETLNILPQVRLSPEKADQWMERDLHGWTYLCEVFLCHVRKFQTRKDNLNHPVSSLRLDLETMSQACHQAARDRTTVVVPGHPAWARIAGLEAIVFEALKVDINHDELMVEEGGWRLALDLYHEAASEVMRRNVDELVNIERICNEMMLEQAGAAGVATGIGKLVKDLRFESPGGAKAE